MQQNRMNILSIYHIEAYHALSVCHMFKLQALNPSINSKALSNEHIINRLGYIRCRYPSRINWSRWKVLTKLFNGFILPTGDVRIMRPSPSFPSMGIRFCMNRAVMHTKLKEIMNYKFDGSRVFFTSDTHFNHTNIIRFCPTPTSTIPISSGFVTGLSRMCHTWMKRLFPTGTEWLVMMISCFTWAIFVWEVQPNG